ncbi:MAG TPA: hypothetical protein VLA09_01265, partial [Longimicrobiales bacterium]|nr:hypothetical protein [Longimicrobiales bacterium]
MRLLAADAAELLLNTSESGGTAAAAVVVAAEADALRGQRVLIERDHSGRETVHGELGSPTLQAAVVALLREAIEDPRTRDGLREVSADGASAEVYLEVRRAAQELVVVGAGHIAQPMAH